MTMNYENAPSPLTLGYDLYKWKDYGLKEPITVDISPATNSHIIICGMSGSGKSYLGHQLLARLILAEQQYDGEYYFCDYKGDDTFSYLRGSPHFFTYNDTLEAIDIVHSRLMARQAGKESTQRPVTLCLDEYMALVLNLNASTGAGKKRAAEIMGHIGNILQLGRSLSVRLAVFCQRPDAIAFPAGSRLNYGIVAILGSAAKSIYEMLMPDFIDTLKGRHFGRGEGIVLLQGSDLRFIKVPTVRDEERMRKICITALGGTSRPPCEA